MVSDFRELLTIAVTAGLAVAVLVAVAELWHVSRIRTVAHLAFGPGRQPRLWARLAGPLRAIAAGAFTWGLVMLLLMPPTSHKEGEVKPNEIRRLVLVLDVSPSMKLKDAGPDGKQRRDQRAADILRSFFERVQKDRYRTTVVATYSEAKPVVEDTTDLEVVRNILTDLPLSQAFKPGPTNILAGVEAAVKIARPWPPGSTVLMVVSDGGDPAPGTATPRLPASISHVIVVGVGNPTTGQSIDGVTSKQDVSSLRQIAIRTQGTYVNANDHQLSTELISTVNQNPAGYQEEPWTAREYALLAVGVGASTLALLPVLLQLWGTGWTPGVRGRISHGTTSRQLLA